MAGAFLPRAVEIVVARNAGRAGAGDEGCAERIAFRQVGDAQRTARAVTRVSAVFLVFGLAEIGQHVVMGPAGIAELAPMVVVLRLAADVEEPVDRGGAAENLAARPVERPAADVLALLGLVEPVDGRIDHGFAVADRNMDPGIPVPAAGLQQRDGGRGIFRQARGKHAACRSRADDDNIRLDCLFAVSHRFRFRNASRLGRPTFRPPPPLIRPRPTTD